MKINKSKNKYEKKIKYIINKVTKKILQIKSNKIFILGRKIILYKNINKLLSIKLPKSKYYFIKKKIKKKNINLPIHLIIIKKKKNDFFNINISINKNIYINIIEEKINISKNKYFNLFLNIIIRKKSYLYYLRIINNNLKTKFYYVDNIQVNTKSKFKNNIFFIKFKKINLISNIKLKKKSILDINNISILQKNYLKFKINVLHCSSNTQSYQKYNNIILEKSIMNFSGWIKIFKQSYFSKAKIKNNNLCICKKSIINTSPKLKIENKNAKCKHNVKINNLNKEIIFYLLTRGIKFQKIKKILILKFIKKILKNKNNIHIYKKIYYMYKKIFK